VKRCCSCRRDLPLEEFHRARTRPDGRQSYCRDCGCARAKTWRLAVQALPASDPKKKAWRKGQRLRRIRHRYDLSAIDQIMLERAAAGRCQICHKASDRLHIDHDHQTGQVRGLLCNRCNNDLKVVEDKEQMTALLRYLADPPANALALGVSDQLELEGAS
jgi:hypothetical protein